MLGIEYSGFVRLFKTDSKPVGGGGLIGWGRKSTILVLFLCYRQSLTYAPCITKSLLIYNRSLDSYQIRCFYEFIPVQFLCKMDGIWCLDVIAMLPANCNDNMNLLSTN